MARRKNLPEMDRLNGQPHTHGCGDLPDFGIQADGKVFIPEHLHEDAQACIEVIKESMPPGIYAKVDSFLLSAFATAWAIHKHAAFKVADPDFLWIEYNAAGSSQKSPWLAIVNDQAKILASLGDRLGLDPKARAGLKLPSEKPKSKFHGLIGAEDKPGKSAH